MPMSRVRAVFNQLRAYVPFEVTLHQGKASEFPETRNMAYCTSELRIYCAPKMDHARIDQIQGVLMHEFGHALAFACGHDHHGERDADEIAETLFGCRIYYDDDLIQSTRSGARPRPRHLG